MLQLLADPPRSSGQEGSLSASPPPRPWGQGGLAVRSGASQSTSPVSSPQGHGRLRGSVRIGVGGIPRHRQRGKRLVLSSACRIAPCRPRKEVGKGFPRLSTPETRKSRVVVTLWDTTTRSCPSRSQLGPVVWPWTEGPSMPRCSLQYASTWCFCLGC